MVSSRLSGQPKEKNIPIETLIINQIDEKIASGAKKLSGTRLSQSLLDHWSVLFAHQYTRAERAHSVIDKLKLQYHGFEALTVPMRYTQQGFEILRANSQHLK